MEADLLFMSVVVFVTLFLLLAAGVWVGFALFIVGFIGMAFFSSLPAGNNMASSVWATIEKGEYVALPLFILMGEILYRSGISERLFRALVPWLYRLPGGLLLMNIVSCTLFAAVSGSSAATTATVGRITLAEFDKLGYDRTLSMGSLAGAGTLGFLIPPSLIMIIYAILAEVSIGKMFMAGILPGLMLSGVYSAYIIYRGIRNPEIAPQSQDSYSWRDRFVGIKDLAPTIILILMVEVSQITPPVGFNLFVIQGITGEPIMKIAHYALPFFFLMLLTTAILTVFPEIALYLPNLMKAN